MTTILVLAGVALVVRWALLAMSAAEARAHSQMLRAVARIKHDHRLRGLNEVGPEEGRVGGVPEGPARRRGVETQSPASPPIVAGTDTTPPVQSVPATPAPADTAVTPRSDRVRRVQLQACAKQRRGLAQQDVAGASDHPADAPATLSPVGAGRCPHAPAPTGPSRVRVMIHGC